MSSWVVLSSPVAIRDLERDSIISHGLAYFLKEKLLDSSDKYEVWVCNECGKFA